VTVETVFYYELEIRSVP